MSPAAAALGVARVAGVLALLAAGTPAVLAAALVPGMVRGHRPAVWTAWALARVLLWVLGVTLVARHAGRVRGHRGFVFFNHASFLDAPVVMALGPVRFLATAGVRRLPLLGWLAAAAGTLFVARGDAADRQAARAALRAAVRQSPTPVALAPEGRIGPGPTVAPLRHGAFETAREAGAAVRLVALRYPAARPDTWRPGEWLLAAVWRLAARTGPFVVTAEALDPLVDPAAGPPERLARDVAARLDAAVAARA